MADTVLTNRDRTKWRSLYRAGWRIQHTPDKRWWWVVDDKGRQRSDGHMNRWSAVAQVVS